MKAKTSLILTLKVILALSLILGVFSTCSRKSHILNPSGQTSPFLFKLNFVETCLLDLIQDVHLIVSSNGDTLADKHLELQNRAISDTIEVQAGADWKFTLQALDASNNIIYSGDTTVSVIAGETTNLQINLYPEVFLLKFDPIYQEVVNDSVFNVEVRLYNVDSLFSTSFRVEFDSSVLFCTDVESGDFLGSSSTIFFSVIDTVKGYVAVGYSLKQGNGSGVSGSGTLARLHFKIRKQAGESPNLADLIFNEETLAFYDPYGERKDWKDSLYIHNAQVLIE